MLRTLHVLEILCGYFINNREDNKNENLPLFSRKKKRFIFLKITDLKKNLFDKKKKPSDCLLFRENRNNASFIH